MFPILYNTNITDLTSLNNGFGFLSDCVSCVIKETLNGEYFLEMVYPLGGLHSEELERGRLIYALRDNDDNKQLFRISQIKINLVTRNMEIYAPHISYDLENYPIPVNYTAKKESAYEWLTYLQAFDFYDVEQPFTFTGDITADYTTDAERMERQPRTVRGLLLTDTDAIIDTYWPVIEFEFDNYEVKFLKHRGTDTGLEIRYGKNLTSLESDDATEPIYYGCVPQFRYDVGETPYYIYGSKRSGSLFDDDDPLKRALTIVDFTEQVTEDLQLELDGEPTAAQKVQIAADLTTLATQWTTQNTIKTIVKQNKGASVTLSYLDMSGAGIYTWNGPRPEDVHADIGDTVTLVYGDLVRQTEIVGIEYNVLKERYDNITVGQVRATLSKTIKQIAEGVK